MILLYMLSHALLAVLHDDYDLSYMSRATSTKLYMDIIMHVYVTCDSLTSSSYLSIALIYSSYHSQLVYI